MGNTLPKKGPVTVMVILVKILKMINIKWIKEKHNDCNNFELIYL
jgi:hypothetical protein